MNAELQIQHIDQSASQALLDDARKIYSECLQDMVEGVILNATDNAWDTINEYRTNMDAKLKFEKFASVQDFWTYMFQASMRGCLSCFDSNNEDEDQILVWFAARGIKA